MSILFHLTGVLLLQRSWFQPFVTVLCYTASSQYKKRRLSDGLGRRSHWFIYTCRKWQRHIARITWIFNTWNLVSQSRFSSETCRIAHSSHSRSPLFSHSTTASSWICAFVLPCSTFHFSIPFLFSCHSCCTVFHFVTTQ